MTTASDNSWTLAYVRGPWVLAYFLAETDVLYGDALEIMSDDTQEGK